VNKSAVNQSNEGKTTLIFAGVAAVAFGLAWWARPDAIATDKDLMGDFVGNSVFRTFENPSESSSFQIVKFDEELAQLERFEVTKDSSTNLWRLPSFDDYPADAAEQVRDATTPLVGLTVLAIPSFDRGDHSLYGVVNPDDEDLNVAETGVGMLVRVKDDKDQILASLIIGKEVPQTEGQRYVRVPTEDAVYVVELDTTPFTTDFKKWIKGKLLDVRGFDISNISLRDYALFRTQAGASMQRNFDADLAYDSSSSKWALGKLVTYDGPTATETPLAEGEMLKDSALNDLRNAIQDLEIVGVFRKPTGLAADLKADQSLLDNNESLQSLYDKGFYPQPRDDGGMEIYSSGGETIVGTKDGVQYLLRFGESTAKMAGSDEDATEESSELRRYLLVMASLDTTQFPPPELEVSPQTVEEMLAMEKAAADPMANALNIEVPPSTEPEQPPSPETPAVEPGAEVGTETTEPKIELEPMPESTEPGTEPNAETPKPQVESEPSPESTDPVSTEPEATETGTAEPAPETPEPPAEGTTEEPSGCEPQEGDDAATADAPAQEGQEPNATVAAPAEQPPAASPAVDAPQEPAAQVETQEELQERLELLQEKIAKDNQRKLDERKEKMDEALKKVQELNARFADWYYLVSDSVYKKLTLSREELITTETADAAAGGLPGAPTGLPPGFQFPGQ
jgi:hypothetical protein